MDTDAGWCLARGPVAGLLEGVEMSQTDVNSRSGLGAVTDEIVSPCSSPLSTDSAYKVPCVNVSLGAARLSLLCQAIVRYSLA